MYAVSVAFVPKPRRAGVADFPSLLPAFMATIATSIVSIGKRFREKKKKKEQILRVKLNLNG